MLRAIGDLFSQVPQRQRGKDVTPTQGTNKKFRAIAAKEAAEAESGDVESTPSNDKKFGEMAVIIRSTCSLLQHGVMEYPSKY